MWSGLGKSTKAVAPEVYPEDIECVRDPVGGVGGIYISNLEAAQNLRTLGRHGIKAVITAANGAYLNHSRSQLPYYKYIPGEDHESYDLAKYFEESIRFLEENLKRTNVLVHCMAGVSRSVTLVLAYLIKSEKMDYDKAYFMIKNRRRIVKAGYMQIRPNSGFVRQLKALEREVRSQNRSLEPEKKFELTPPTKRYQTPETRQSTAITDFNSTTKISTVQSRMASPLKTYSSTHLKKTTYLTTCSDLELGTEEEIDQKIAEIRKKYALPERKHQNFFEGSRATATANLEARSPLTDHNRQLFSAPNQQDLKLKINPSHSSSYASRRLKTNDLYENEPAELLKRSTLNLPRSSMMFESGVGIGLPIRKKITMDERQYMCGRY